ncbi:DNA gyrase subunit A [Mesomycoplasma conjunctivae]|uniref:DNA topoisomerase (ATP-hydrolyzing) n=1 Tax=Mesomycoplasma conjunctivae (strain ATCC 25834 / NCTC 10147 / HRC/581) TaxID=572263 RepID=C5J5K8_MESCH|nr:DNA gyrase subunit A [Mesomycoplasma conjunctivae]CAT04731.1 DNA gyrase subunit A [Mesomycoplasma conjunctivae]VEU65739.1 DNA gyrase subunit A [Mesomycoplasma conjunctivae]
MIIDEKDEKDVEKKDFTNNPEDDEIKVVFNEAASDNSEDDEEILPQNQDDFQLESQVIDSEKNNIIPKQIEEEMRNSFLDYSMSVIISRALPDVRDGLKPVHRRILYTMSELGIVHNSAYKKSARIVGDVLGKYHPHGDTSVYDSMVRMAQPFSLRYPLVDGHGNFGSIDGDEAAAMRYTEARMSKIASLMVEGIKKNTVDFIPNYDGSEQEPNVLPVRFPNLLVSGVSGIAVGMATKIPPHNLTEVINSFILLAKNNDISVEELAQSLPGPDFPTGATIFGVSGIQQAYKTGRGSFILRAKAKIETFNSGKSKIIFYEIPYEVKKPAIIEKVVQLVKEKRLQGIKDVRDETNRQGIRVVFEIKKGFNPEIILNQLYKETDFQISYSMNMLAIVKGEPKLLNLKEILYQYLLHQKEINLRGLNFDLEKYKEKLNVLLGVKVAVENIDEVVKIIKSSSSDAQAQEKLGKRFDLNPIQTKAIVDMRLGRLTSLAIEKLMTEIEQIKAEINRIEEIIASDEKLVQLVIDQHLEIINNFADPRRSEINGEIGNIIDEDLIPRSDVIISLTDNNYVKRINLEEYRVQNRGGVGSSTSSLYKDDYLKGIWFANTHTDLLIITSKAKIFKLRTHQIPDSTKQGKGIPFVNLLPIEKDEQIYTLLVWNQDYAHHFLVTVSRLGLIKKTPLEFYKNINKNGKYALKLNENDTLVSAFIVKENEPCEVLIGSSSGKVNKFDFDSIRSTGRVAMGVKGIKLTNDEFVIGASHSLSGEYVFALGRFGYGKKTSIDEYRQTSRNSKGVKTLNTEKAGSLCFISIIKGNEEALIVTKKGILIRTSLQDINITSRNTKGVKIINIKDNDEIQSVTIVDKFEE